MEGVQADEPIVANDVDKLTDGARVIIARAD